MNEKTYQWRIEIEQHLPSFLIDSRFENRVVAENHQPRFVSITMQLTTAELDDFMSTIEIGYDCRIISITNMSECLVWASLHAKDVVKLEIWDGSRRFIWSPLEVFQTILKSESDIKRMKANFDREEPFRTWIDQSDWNELLEHSEVDRLKFTFGE